MNNQPLFKSMVWIKSHLVLVSFPGIEKIFIVFLLKSADVAKKTFFNSSHLVIEFEGRD